MQIITRDTIILSNEDLTKILDAYAVIKQYVYIANNSEQLILSDDRAKKIGANILSAIENFLDAIEQR